MGSLRKTLAFSFLLILFPFFLSFLILVFLFRILLFFIVIIILGLRFETINFHLLTHSTECVSLYGPLWTTSCFPFENGNGFLVRCITGTNNSFVNVLNSALCLGNIRAILKSVINRDCLTFVQRLIPDGEDDFGGYNPRLVVSLSFFPPLVTYILIFFILFHSCSRGDRRIGGVVAVGPVKLAGESERVTFSRVNVGHLRLESLSYLRNKNRNNSTIKTRDGSYYLVKGYFAEKDAVFAEVIRLELVARSDYAPQLSNFTPREEATISALDIVEGPLLVLARGSKMFFIDVVLSPEVN
jgi:hypothetical protein